MIGGDRRQISMAKDLAERGYDVRVWGLGKCRDAIGEAVACTNWETAVRDADAVILPLPASLDGLRVHCPLHDQDVFLRVTTLLDAITGRFLLGGRITPPIRSIAEQKNVRWIDYYESELLQQKNALPTAEGAIAIAMQELPVTVDGVSAAVIGYGRIGALLADKLSSLGARVTVYARRRESLTAAELRHHAIARIANNEGGSGIDAFPKDCRVIFNTVPHRLISNDALSLIPRDCVYVELASPPGGIDHSAATEKGLRVVWGAALPGKCAPESAGRILSEALTELLEAEFSL